MLEISSQVTGPSHSREMQIWDTAQKLEASFLSEMLKAAGLGESQSSFSGSAGESQFASFMRDAQAQKMVEAGGIGLAEAFFNSIKEMDNVKTKK